MATGYDKFFEGAAETADPPFEPSIKPNVRGPQTDPVGVPPQDNPADNYDSGDAPVGPGRADPQPQDRPPVR